MSFPQLPPELDQVLRTLSDRERIILELHFGLKEGQRKTLAQIGEHFNVSRERIRQIEAKALRKMRHPKRSGPIKAALTEGKLNLSEEPVLNLLTAIFGKSLGSHP